MVENLLVGNPWVALAVCVTAYATAHSLTLYETYLYHAGVKNYIVFQGSYELTPAVQKVVAEQRLVSARFVGVLLVLSVGVLAVWGVSVQLYHRPEVFAFLLGGLVLFEATDCMQSLRQIVLFRHAQKAEGVQGKIEYSKRLTFTLSFVELYSFAALYLLMFILSGSWFLLGGALTCLVAAQRRRDWVIVRT